MGSKDDKSDSENGSYSDSLEIFDDIFGEAADAAATETKKERPSSSAPSVKAASPPPVKKSEQRPAPQQAPPVKKAASTAQPIKTGVPAEPAKPKEKEPVSESKDAPSSGDVELFDNIFSEGTDTAATETKKEQPPSTAPSGKAPTPKQVQKAEQRPAPPKVPPEKKAEPPAQPVKEVVPAEPAKPKGKEPGPGSKDGSSSDGVELFDNIFSDRTDATATETKKERPRAPAPPVKADSETLIKKSEQRPAPPKILPAEEATTPPTQIVKSERSFEVDAYLEKRPDRDEGSGKKEIGKMVSYEKTRKNVNPFIFISSIVVLVILSMLTGMVIDYNGIIEGIKNTRHFKSEKKAPVRTVEDKENEKNIDKDAKAGGITGKRSEIKGPDIEAPQQLKEVTPPVKNKAHSEVPAQDTDEVIPSEDRGKGEASPVSAAPPIPEKTADEGTGVLNEETLSYPYSVYIGSYNTVEGVKEATSDYQEMGLSPYWIKMDLGEKGIWFRLYANYFQTREDADRLIKTKQISGAESKKTNLVNLIGIYSSEEEVNKQKEVIEKLGYCPYAISDNKNVFRLYVGAFYQKDQAEEQNAELLLKGIQSKVVER